MSLQREIVGLLVRKRGAQLNLREIGDRLGMECGHEGEPWQNVCRLAQALACLEEREKIATVTVRGEPFYRIQPPKEDENASR